MPFDPISVFVRHWRTVLLTGVVLGGLVAGGRLLLVPRPYEASVMLAVVQGSPIGGSLQSLARLSGFSFQEGLTATPDLLATLLQGSQVLTNVGRDTVGGRRVLEALRDEDPGETPVWKYPKVMRNLVSVRTDRRSGLIEVSVVNRDSAAARRAVARLVDAAGTAFDSITRAQTAAWRKGMEERVDSLGDELHRAEAALAAFIARNRVVPPFSSASVQQQELERTVSIATEAYRQTIIQREGAIAQELGRTSVLVTVDPLPVQLPRASRYVAFFGLAGFWIGAVLSFSWFLFRAWVGTLADADDRLPSRAALALARSRWLGRWLQAPGHS